MTNFFSFAVVELRTHRCGCTWWLTEAELDRARDTDTFRCLHRDNNPLRELARVRLTQAEFNQRTAEKFAHACKN